MVKEEEIIAEAGGGRGYMDMLGLGEEAMADYFLCLSPSSSAYLSSASVSTTTSATPAAAAASPTCASYLAPLPCHNILSFSGQAEQCHGGGLFGFQYYGGGDRAIPVAVPEKSSPTTECSSSISSMSSSPTATAISAISSSKPQAFKKKGSRGSDQRKTAPATTTNKRPRVRRERLRERILALQQLVSPFGKSDTASVLHEALGYVRFLHDQVQVLSSPYMQRLPPSARAPGVVEPRPSDLRTRGLCLVPISCTDHVSGTGDGSDIWSLTTAGLATMAAEGEDEEAAAMLRGDHPGQLT